MSAVPFVPTPRSTAARDKDRVSYDRDAAYAAIDEAWHCHIAYLAPITDARADSAGTDTNGAQRGGAAEPRLLPTLHARVGDTLYIHGSTGSTPLLAARGAAGLPICVAITHLDGLVLARSQFSHSANYRSVIVHGMARLVTDIAERDQALTALVDKVAPGRAADCRPPARKEFSQTAVLAVALTEVSLKTRTGGVTDDDEDLALPHWAGVVPIRTVTDRAEPAPGVGVPVPDYLRPERGAWLTAAPMVGEHVRLEPLDMSHVEELFAAVADDEVYQWLPRRPPTTVEQMAAEVRDSLRMHDEGHRVPFVQRHAGTGEIIGTTSYHAVDEANRRLAIGYTMLARRWWRTGVNTEAKLLLLTRAFDVLGASRVEWYTDVRNVRSQRAIERLGAIREGVLRRHRPLPDGSSRDSVVYSMIDPEWPAARQRLRDMLRHPVRG